MLKEGQKATFNHQAISDGNHSIHVYPCDSYVKKTKAYGDQVGTITRVFEGNHTGNITMEDGKIFHIKSNFVNIVNES